MLPLIAGGLISGVGGIIGGLFSGGDRDKANRLLNEAYEEITKTGAPPDESQEIILNKFKSAGMLTPQVEQAVNAGVSKAAEMVENPENRNIQMSALQQIQSRTAGGLNAQDRAAFNQNRLAAQRDQQGKQQQIIQNMQARNQGGAGAELQAALLASQAGADSEAEAGDRIASAAAQNALSAAGQAGSLGSQVRSQDYNAQLQKAQAADELNRFNVQAQMGRQQRNVAAQNDANQFNLVNQQKAVDANTTASNQELMRQKDAQRQFWNDKLNYANAQANAKAGQANAALGQANQTANMFNSLGQGIGNAVTASGNADRADANQENILNRMYPKNSISTAANNPLYDKMFSSLGNRIS